MQSIQTNPGTYKTPHEIIQKQIMGGVLNILHVITVAINQKRFYAAILYFPSTESYLGCQ